MPKPRENTAIYPLSPSQKIIMYQQSFCLSKNVVQIPFSFETKKRFDFDLMKRAIQEEIKRNDCLRLRFFKKKGEIFQYFVPSCRLDNIPTYEFSSISEQNKVLLADADVPVRSLKDENYRIILFRTADGKSGVYINVYHTVMDGMAVGIFFNDLCKVYDALESGSEMPAPLDSFEESLKRDLAAESNKPRRDKDREFWQKQFIEGGRPIYSGVEGPWLLEKYRKKHKDPNYGAVGVFHPLNENAAEEGLRIDSDIMDQVRKAAISISVSAGDFVQTAMRIYLSALNNDTGDVSFFELCARRNLRADRNTCGCRCHVVDTRTKFSLTDTFDDVAKQLSGVHLQAFRHADLGTLEIMALEDKFFDRSRTEAYMSLMFTYMPEQPYKENDAWRRRYWGYSPTKYAHPMYAYFHEDPTTGGVDCHYIYRLVTVKRQNIIDLHSGMLTILRAAADDPTMTVAELKKLWFKH